MSESIEHPIKPTRLAAVERAVDILDDLPGGNVILTKVESLLNWGRAASLWPLTFGLACCAIEMMAAFAGRFDLDRMGVTVRKGEIRRLR